MSKGKVTKKAPYSKSTRKPRSKELISYQHMPYTVQESSPDNEVRKVSDILEPR